MPLLAEDSIRTNTTNFLMGSHSEGFQYCLEGKCLVCALIDWEHLRQ